MLPPFQLHRRWRGGNSLFSAARECCHFGEGENRSTSYVFSEDEQEWVAPLAESGPGLLDDLEALFGVRFPIVAVQGYREGSGTDWHADTPFDAQAILSLGASRTFRLERTNESDSWSGLLEDGDLLYMPSGTQTEWLHSIPEEPDRPGERCSLVFRTKAGT